MNHQPFEDWLLEPTKLSAKQRGELHVHLQACTTCSALAEVDLALKSTRMVEPREGFSERFQVRLVERKARLQRRQVGGFILLALAVTGALLWLAWPLVAQVIGSPANTLATWLSDLISLWTSLLAMGHVSELLFKTLPSFVPPLAWMAIFLGACCWGVIWIFSMMKFAKKPQGV